MFFYFFPRRGSNLPSGFGGNLKVSCAGEGKSLLTLLAELMKFVCFSNSSEPVSAVFRCFNVCPARDLLTTPLKN